MIFIYITGSNIAYIETSRVPIVPLKLAGSFFNVTRWEFYTPPPGDGMIRLFR